MSSRPSPKKSTPSELTAETATPAADAGMASAAAPNPPVPPESPVSATTPGEAPPAPDVPTAAELAGKTEAPPAAQSKGVPYGGGADHRLPLDSMEVGDEHVVECAKGRVASIGQSIKAAVRGYTEATYRRFAVAADHGALTVTVKRTV